MKVFKSKIIIVIALLAWVAPGLRGSTAAPDLSGVGSSSGAEGTSSDYRGPILLGLFGAPASGKSYGFNNLSKWGINIFDQYVSKEPAKRKVFENLTVDILRGDIWEMPAIIQTYFFFSSFQWFNAAFADARRRVPIGPLTYGDTLVHETFRAWKEEQEGFLREKVFAFIETVSDGKLHGDISEEEGLIFKESDKRIPLSSFIKKLEDNGWANRFLEHLKADGVLYSSFKRVVRFHQDMLMKQAAARGINVLLDETGGNVFQLKRLLMHFKKKDYLNIIVMIHPTSIMVNFMQNAYRMIKGSDGGRDSSSSIADTYAEIEAGLDLYREITQSGGYIVISNDGEKEAAIQYLNSLRRGELIVKSSPAVSFPLIDAFIKVSTSTPEETNTRILAELGRLTASEEKVNLYYAILKLHRDNPDKGGKLTGSAKDAMEAFPISMDKETAFDVLKRAVESRSYEGITQVILDEAATVWELAR